MKRYVWENLALKKRYNRVFGLTIVLMVAVLACLFLLPGNIKMVNLAILVAAFITWVISYRIQNQDKSIKARRLSQEAKNAKAQ